MGFFGFFSNVFSAIKTLCTSVFRHFSINKTTHSNNSWNDYQNDRSLHVYPNKYCSDKTPCKSSLRSYGAHEQTSEFLQMAPLDEFRMPMNILAIERNENPLVNSNEMIDEWISQKAQFRLLEDLYIGAYKTMAFFEEAAETITTTAFNLTHVTLNVTLNKDVGKEIYFNVTTDSKELCTAIDDKQLNYFTLKSRTSLTMLNGKITRRASEKIFIEIFNKQFESGEIYDIFFKVNRTNFQLQHNALCFIKRHRLFPILINNPAYEMESLQLLRYPSDLHFQSVTNQNELNAEQLQAIECIVNGKYHPVPNLLYGPPGTGKTKTVVAAIEKIVRTTTKNILVCAQSNAACNEIAERLTKVLTPTEMLRMFSKSYDLNEISSTIKPFCNLIDEELQYPSLNNLYKFRVLICTLSVSGCLVRARNSPYFNSTHFGYVFIDECASAHETMALIPIAGLCTSMDRVNANIVLIGDPKQLDAVTKSNWSAKLGFKTSWFEQLFNLTMYQRVPMTGKFNQTYISQLVKNYRSHRAILKVPNELFYENMLEAVATPDFVRLEVEGLLSKTFPIIFKSVHGYCQKDDKDPSLYNMKEVHAVLEFIEELLKPHYQIVQSDIGVVSPYKRQCKIIRSHCGEKSYKDITIGSAETFQGQERKVMIISCVRNGMTLGNFLKNPQRFNVMITRAKSLLIVVGNPHVLLQDENWSTFIRYCFKNRCLIQDTKYFRPRDMTS